MLHLVNSCISADFLCVRISGFTLSTDTVEVYLSLCCEGVARDISSMTGSNVILTLHPTRDTPDIHFLTVFCDDQIQKADRE